MNIRCLSFSKYTPQINSNRLTQTRQKQTSASSDLFTFQTLIQLEFHSTHVNLNSLCTFNCQPLTIMYTYDTVQLRKQLQFLSCYIFKT